MHGLGGSSGDENQSGLQRSGRRCRTTYALATPAASRSPLARQEHFRSSSIAPSQLPLLIAPVCCAVPANSPPIRRH